MFCPNNTVWEHQLVPTTPSFMLSKCPTTYTQVPKTTSYCPINTIVHPQELVPEYHNAWFSVVSMRYVMSQQYRVRTWVGPCNIIIHEFTSVPRLIIKSKKYHVIACPANIIFLPLDLVPTTSLWMLLYSVTKTFYVPKTLLCHPYCIMWEH